jgi:hypothetical protein
VPGWGWLLIGLSVGAFLGALVMGALAGVVNQNSRLKWENEQLMRELARVDGDHDSE